MIELLPCPFCGSAAHLGTYSGADCIWCAGDDCGAAMGGEEYMGDEHLLIKWWNRRPNPIHVGELDPAQRLALARGEES